VGNEADQQGVASPRFIFSFQQSLEHIQELRDHVRIAASVLQDQYMRKSGSGHGVLSLSGAAVIPYGSGFMLGRTFG
jgi:hypothetical protein